MNSETRKCQNCKNGFVIEPDDFAFYEKIQVPPPTWCPECRMIRRTAFRNERTLYKRKCDAHGHNEEIITMYSQDKEYTVFDNNYWWSDKWDPLERGIDFDVSVSFMKQVGKLIKTMPRQALLNFNAVNSDYCNYTTDNKNCYLVFGGDFNEDSMYSGFPMKCKKVADLYWVLNSELCYEVVDADRCYKVLYSNRVGFCVDSMFLYNCSNLSNCFGCINLKNKQYCIFNRQYSKQEYKDKLEELIPNSYESLVEIKKQFERFKLTQPRRFAHNIKVVNCTGENIYQANDCQQCFDIVGPAEHIKDVWMGGWGLTDTRGCDHLGHSTELAHDSFALFSGCNNIICSYLISSSNNVFYSYNCRGCTDIFGCVGLRNKSYCVLNKQYSKEGYKTLIAKIKQHMTNNPYIDNLGRRYTYGDFFASDFSLFGYNETVAQEQFPLDQSSAQKHGFTWHINELKSYKPTIEFNHLPDTISQTNDNIVEEIISCKHGGECSENCTKAFRITKTELDFYRRIDVPLPRFCYNCRHARRIQSRYPLKLWHRSCQCNGMQSSNKVYTNTSKSHQTHTLDKPCPIEFETSYAPEREEIVYCEACYKQEVI